MTDRDKQIEDAVKHLKYSPALWGRTKEHGRVLIEEIERLQQERDKWHEAYLTMQGELNRATFGADAEVSQLREERDKLKEALVEIEDESSQEDADITRINGIAQDTIKALGIGEES